MVTLSHRAYPDNPDMPLLSKDYGSIVFNTVELVPSDTNTARPKLTLRLRELASSRSSDFVGEVIFKNLDILHFLPTIPEAVKADPFLAKVAVVNQEWNRQQVKFVLPDDRIAIAGKKLAQRVDRVDLARNCLRSGLWEVFLFEKTSQGDRILYHGWFDFPLDTYAALYDRKNKVAFSTHADSLVKWKDLPSATVSYEHLRYVSGQQTVAFENLNGQLYPMIGERKKKAPNIVFPDHYQQINDFLTDSTTYATFAEPGFYTRSDPRRTRLSLLRYPSKLLVRRIKTRVGKTKDAFEIEVDFTDSADKTTPESTRPAVANSKARTDKIVAKLIFGGLQMSDLPVLDSGDVHRGFQMPMGIGNHSFYETYDKMKGTHWDDISYYGVASDGNNHFIDSHELGIDGPLMFRDKADPTAIHVFVLSFERHSFVGHYKFKMPHWVVSDNDTESNISLVEEKPAS